MAGNMNVRFNIQAINNFSNVMDRLDRDLNEAEGGLNRLQAASGAVGRALGAMGIAVGGAMAFAVDKAAKFEHAMSSVKAVSGASAEEMSKLTSLAKEMGATTSFSASEAAKGIEELMKAGVKTDDILGPEGLKGALDLAVAGELELAEAAEIASTALNAFKNDNLTVADAGNILAGAANSSATSVHELRYSLSMVSAVASGLGLSFEDTNAALAVLANNGIKGSDAGTSLKTMFSRLNPMTEKAQGQMMDLGIVTEDGANKFFTAEGNIRSMAEIAGVLETALKGMSAEQKQAALYTMFGSDAIRAGLILSKEGAAGINEMTAAMSKVTAAEVAAERLNNFKGALTILKSAIEGAAIALGTSLLPALTNITQFLTALISKFVALPESMQAFIAIGAVIAAVVMLIAGAIILLMPGIMATVSAFQLLVPVIQSAIAAALPVVGVIAAIVAALVLIGIGLFQAYQHVGWFRDMVNAAWASIKSGWNAAVQWVANITKQVMSAVSAFFGSQLAKIRAFWSENGSQISSIARGFMEFVKSTIQNGMKFITGIFQVAWPLISTLARVSWELTKAIISSAISIILGVIKAGLAVLRGDWQGAFNAILGIAKNIMNNITSFFRNINLFETGKNIIRGLINGIKSMGSAVMSQAKAIANGITNTIKGALRIKSPSRVMMKLGGFTSEGLAKGMTDELRRVQSAASQLATSAVPSMSRGYSPTGSVNQEGARPSVTNNSPINVTLNYNGSGSADDAQAMIDMVSRGLEKQFGNQARVSGVKGV